MKLISGSITVVVDVREGSGRFFTHREDRPAAEDAHRFGARQEGAAGAAAVEQAAGAGAEEAERAAEREAAFDSARAGGLRGAQDRGGDSTEGSAAGWNNFNCFRTAFV